MLVSTNQQTIEQILNHSINIDHHPEAKTAVKKEGEVYLITPDQQNKTPSSEEKRQKNNSDSLKK